MGMLGKLKGKVEDGEKLVAGAKDKAQDAFRNTIGEINALAEVLENCGFILGDLAISVGLMPKVQVTIEQREHGSADLEKLAEREGELTKTQTAVLKSLQRIYDMNDMVEAEGYTLGQVDIELGVPPSVSVHLISMSSRAFETSDDHDTDNQED